VVDTRGVLRSVKERVGRKTAVASASQAGPQLIRTSQKVRFDFCAASYRIAVDDAFGGASVAGATGPGNSHVRATLTKRLTITRTQSVSPDGSQITYQDQTVGSVSIDSRSVGGDDC